MELGLGTYSLPGWNIPSSGGMTSNLSYDGNVAQNAFKGGNMFPFMAAASLGSSVISGISGGQAANRQAEAEIAAAREQAQGVRDAAFTNLLAGQYGQTGAKMFDQFLQKNAANYQQAFLDPRKSQFASEEKQRGIADSLSPGAQQLRFQNKMDLIDRDTAAKTAVLDRMFGASQGPFSYGRMPGYINS